MCPNVIRTAQEGDCGEVGFRTVTGVMHTRIECRVLSEDEGGKVEENVVDDEVQDDLSEELAARRRRMWG